ncbi:unnamed protein product [Vitrella brassicaformis CCMP3155]|uniref:Uncharacterized protein n=1 Tax=Vitrella brassicaformis (strain CCMP3155) TaxID=1169540 RepID=A0A0G4EN20_VITBC|nr:unnamed protein product [Vitrella brassicaformis CCMP3155]|eukprot:CEL98390.1 unnamed protein product [Vitrella brassicaformis CCMP3155]
MTYPSVEQPSLAQPQPVNWPSADIASPTTAPAYDVPQTMPVVIGKPMATADTAGRPEGVYNPGHEDEKSGRLTCLKVSCVLSVLVFPIIGCIAFCLTMDAKKGSQRRKWARICLATGTIMTILFVTWLVMVIRSGDSSYSYSYSYSF